MIEDSQQIKKNFIIDIFITLIIILIVFIYIKLIFK